MRKITIQLLTLSILFGTTFTSKAEVFSWKDENGNIVYGDSPEKGTKAESVKLNPTTIINFPKTKKAAESEPEKEEPTNPISYSAINISSPTNNSTVRDNSGTVLVTVNTQPALAKGDKIQVYLNGASTGEALESTSFTIKNVDRGEHQINASLFNQEGQKLLTSPSVKIFVHRFVRKKSP